MRVVTDDKHYKAIAKEIREQNPFPEDIGTMKPNEMASNISKVVRQNFDAGATMGYADGYTEGKAAGYSEGLSKGEADGKLAEYDRFWDALQDNGNRRNYWGAFCGWSDEIFKPKYRPITADTANSMFYMSTITNVPEIDFRGTTGLASTFAYAQSLEKIDNIKLNEYGTQTFNGTFNGCKALKEVRFEGAIGNDISFQPCVALSKESIENIFKALLPPGDVSGKTLTLSKAALKDAFGSNTDEEWQNLLGTRSNWTVAYL